MPRRQNWWDRAFAPVPDTTWYRPWLMTGPPVNPDKTIARQIMRDVSRARGFEVDALTGIDRHAPVVAARYEAISRIREQTSLSLSAIGRLFNRDHTTIGYALQAVA